jgi:dextranase
VKVSRIEQSQDGGVTWSTSSLNAPLTGQATNATVVGLAANTDYKFRLVAEPLATEAPPLDVTEPGQWLLDVYTDKARYTGGQTVQLSIDIKNKRNIPVNGRLDVEVFHLNRKVASQSVQNVTLNATSGGVASQKTVTAALSAPNVDFRGYRVDVQWVVDGVAVDRRSGAFDVSSDWKRFPRYGYITDFPSMTEAQVEQVIKRLNRFHINALQYYDWQWKHHIPVKMDGAAPAAVWKDIANRDVYAQTIRHYVARAKQRNMLNMNYNLMFGAYVGAEADGVLPQWGLYKDRNRQTQDAHPLPSSWASNRILLMNPFHDGWVNYILATEKTAFDMFGFDGWHIDQLGSRGTLYDYNGNEVKFDDAYGYMLHKIKSGLQTRMVMNAVSEYGVQQIAAAPVDVLYTEVWPFTGDKSYAQLKRYVETGLQLGGGTRGQVLAAYMNYEAAEQPGFFNTPAVLLTDAVIMAAGGTHLELGDTGMLGKEYFPNKNLQVSTDLDERLKQYYDFQTAYQNWLMDGVRPIDLVVRGVSGGTVTEQPQAGAIWAFARQARGAQMVHFINLSGNKTTDWRDDFANNVTMPNKKSNIKIKLQTSVQPGRALVMSPDGDMRAIEVPFTVAQISDGKYEVELTVPELTLWTALALVPEIPVTLHSVWISAKTAVSPPAADMVAPSVPGGVTASQVTTSGFRVTWTASTDNVGVAGYNVYRNGAYFATVTSPSVTFSGLTANTTYQIRILAYDAAKNRSALSAELSVKTLSTVPVADVVAPSVPSGVTAAQVSVSGFRVTWTASTDNIGVTGYNVYRNGAYFATVTSPSVTFSGLAVDTTYRIRVLAYDAAKNRSALSAELSVKTLSTVPVADVVAPSVPGGVTAAQVTTSGFRVTWTASTDNIGVAGYNVYRNGAYFATVTSPSVTFSGLAVDTTYRIRVLAYDAAKNKSAMSTELLVKTLN